MPRKPPVFVNAVVARNRAARPRERKTARQSGDHNRPHSRARGYDRTWERLRRRHLNANPWCAECLKRGVVTPATVGDHVITIEERPDLRLDPANIQSLCASCHSSIKQRQDVARKRARRAGLIAGTDPPPPRDPAGGPSE